MVESMTSLKSLLFAEGEMALAARRDGVLFPTQGFEEAHLYPILRAHYILPKHRKR
jgi:hypothetical protein